MVCMESMIPKGKTIKSPLSGKVKICQYIVILTFQRQRAPAAFVKFDLESQSPMRNKFGRCIPIQTGMLPFAFLSIVNPLRI